LTDAMDEQAVAEPTAAARLLYGTVSDKKFASKRKKESNALTHFGFYLSKKRGIETPIKNHNTQHNYWKC
jgi:hypothetical protein